MQCMICFEPVLNLIECQAKIRMLMVDFNMVSEYKQAYIHGSINI